jgi:hypothetical protein
MPPIDTRRLRDAPVDTELADAIRSSLLQALYTRFGERMVETVARSLGNAPLTAGDADRILKAAAALVQARESAFAAAGLDAKDFAWGRWPTLGTGKPNSPKEIPCR